MIGDLPKSVNIGGKEFSIRSDFRDCLLLIQAYSDPDLSEYEKAIVALQVFFIENPSEDQVQESLEKVLWFLNGGRSDDDDSDNKKVPSYRLYDFEQDEQMIFSAINKVAGREVRNDEYLHWWTFLGYFNEIGEGMFSTVVSIRQKKLKGKKLEKYEQDFYKKNKNIIDLKKRYSEEEKISLENDKRLLNEILGL